MFSRLKKPKHTFLLARIIRISINVVYKIFVLKLFDYLFQFSLCSYYSAAKLIKKFKSLKVFANSFSSDALQSSFSTLDIWHSIKHSCSFSAFR